MYLSLYFFNRACLAAILNQSTLKTVSDIDQDERLSAYFTTLTAGNIVMQEDNDSKGHFVRDIMLKGSTVIEKWNEGIINGPTPSWVSFLIFLCKIKENFLLISAVISTIMQV